jgi:hypothetical protein
VRTTRFVWRKCVCDVAYVAHKTERLAALSSCSGARFHSCRLFVLRGEKRAKRSKNKRRPSSISPAGPLASRLLSQSFTTSAALVLPLRSKQSLCPSHAENAWSFQQDFVGSSRNLSRLTCYVRVRDLSDRYVGQLAAHNPNLHCFHQLTFPFHCPISINGCLSSPLWHSTLLQRLRGLLRDREISRGSPCSATCGGSRLICGVLRTGVQTLFAFLHSAKNLSTHRLRQLAFVSTVHFL